MKGERQYLRCPTCGKKRVTIRYRRNGEDHYACDRCDFYVYASGDEHRPEWAALNEANPEALL